MSFSPRRKRQRTHGTQGPKYLETLCTPLLQFLTTFLSNWDQLSFRKTCRDILRRIRPHPIRYLRVCRSWGRAVPGPEALPDLETLSIDLTKANWRTLGKVLAAGSPSTLHFENKSHITAQHLTEDQTRSVTRLDLGNNSLNMLDSPVWPNLDSLVTRNLILNLSRGDFPNLRAICFHGPRASMDMGILHSSSLREVEFESMTTTHKTFYYGVQILAVRQDFGFPPVRVTLRTVFPRTTNVLTLRDTYPRLVTNRVFIQPDRAFLAFRSLQKQLVKVCGWSALELFQVHRILRLRLVVPEDEDVGGHDEGSKDDTEESEDEEFDGDDRGGGHEDGDTGPPTPRVFVVEVATSQKVLLAELQQGIHELGDEMTRFELGEPVDPARLSEEESRGT